MDDRRRWPDERLDDLAAMVRALTPTMTQIAVHDAKLEEARDDRDEIRDGMRAIREELSGVRQAVLAINERMIKGRRELVLGWLAFAAPVTAVAVGILLGGR